MSPGRNGGAVLRCFAGCDTGSIVEALGLTLADLFDGELERADAPDTDMAWFVANYDYADADGTVLYQVRRLQFLSGRKSFRQRQPNGRGWRNNLTGVERTLYRLPELRRACTEGRAVWYVEGERDVETLRRLGKMATTAGAATAWRDELVEHLRGARSVTVVADRDATGYELARRVARAVHDADPAVPVRVLESPFGKDVTEHIEAGHALDELVPLDGEAVAPTAEVETDDPVDPFEAAVAAEVLRLTVRNEAARRVATEGAVDLPAAIDGASLLATEDDPLTWRIAELLSVGDNLLLAAERKAGKTTLAMNLVVATLRGDTFLDRATMPVEGAVAYWDAELGRRRFRAWLRDIDIGDRAASLSYRDFRALPFPAVFDDDVAESIARELRAEGVRLWVIDPAVHAIARWPTTASSAESDNVTVTQFTNRLDEIKTAAGVSELVVVHHAGKDGTGRGRGASRWEDWPDVIWGLRRNKAAAGGSTFQALGRDVELDWVDLSYSKSTKRVGIARPGWRAGIDEVIAAITEAGGRVVGAGALEEFLTGDGAVRQRKIRDAREAGEVVRQGEKPAVFTLADDLSNMVI